jgi:hypothetical protein
VETAVTMRSVTNSMGSVVKGMDKAMESMNLERVSRPSTVRGHLGMWTMFLGYWGEICSYLGNRRIGDVEG